MTPGKASSAGGQRLTLAALAERLGGRVEGDGGREISGVAGLREAGPGDVSVYTSRRYLEALKSTRAAAVIAAGKTDTAGRDALRVENPQLAFALAIEIFHPRPSPPPGVHPTAVIEDGASVDVSASVGPLCVVAAGASVGPRAVLGAHTVVGAGAVIGAGSLLHPRVTVGDRVRLGERVIIHSGAVIGSDGFGYVFDGGRHRKIPQVGTVEIGDDVEIGANTTVDRATVGTTRIGEGTKIDNLVQVAHNVEIGRHAVIVAQVGISGSTKIGSFAVLGGQVGTVGHITIGDGARIGAQSGVVNSVPAGETRSGIGPIPHRQWLKAQAVFDNLPELRDRVRKMEKKLDELSRRREE